MKKKKKKTAAAAARWESLFYDPARASAFSTLKKLAAASGDREKDVRPWLEAQDPYTLHRPIRKRFPRNPYTVTNMMELWEADLLDLQSLRKFNDGYTYLLTVIDAFTKYLHAVPLRSKTGPAVASAFRSILEDPRYSRAGGAYKRPQWLRTDRGKEFLNATFQDLLKREGIRFQVCRNPDIKCSIVERVQRTVRERLNKYFTFKNTHRYIDVLDKFIAAYNDTPHTTTGIAPARVRDTDVLAVWRRLAKRGQRVAGARVRFSVGQHVRISREKMRFAKGSERNYTTEIFKIVKVIPRSPRPVYELQDLRGQEIDGQFYGEELTPVRITRQTEYKIDKILDSRGRGRSREVLVSWRGYGPEFNSWILASDVKEI